MLFIIGLLVVIGSVIGGYLMHHGNLAVLWQPSEFIIIGGAAVGSFIIANNGTVIKGVLGGFKLLFAPMPFSKKQMYMEMLGFFFELAKTMRTKGIKEVEQQIDHPHESVLFQKYPLLMKDHHVENFICDNIRLIVMGTVLPHQLEELMDEEIHIHHTERHAVTSAVTIMSDATPALGIVAAVLGVIVTMGSITEPPAVLGKLVGAALVGTFFGVLLSYGVLGPIAKNLEGNFAGEASFYACLKVAILNFSRQISPQMIVEFTRKQIPNHIKPSFNEAEEYLNSITAAGGSSKDA